MAELGAVATNENILPAVLDLSDRSSIRDFVQDFKQTHRGLHLLVNYAQSIYPSRQETPDQIEKMWATNVLGVYQLTARLMPMLRYCRPSRIVNIVSRHAGGLDLTDSQFQRRRWSSARALYAVSQAQQMLTWAWAAGLDASTVTVNAVDPGPIRTARYTEVSGLTGHYLRAVDRWSGAEVTQAAASIIWAAIDPQLAGVTDTLLSNRRVVASHAFRDRENLLALVSLCEGTSRVRVQYDSNAFFQEEYDSTIMNRTFQGY